MGYRYGSHTLFQIEYHFVWVTKYRYKVLTGEIAESGYESRSGKPVRRLGFG
jgi:REP element-mobilizing transposase RayT